MVTVATIQVVAAENILINTIIMGTNIIKEGTKVVQAFSVQKASSVLVVSLEVK